MRGMTARWASVASTLGAFGVWVSFASSGCFPELPPLDEDAIGEQDTASEHDGHPGDTAEVTPPGGLDAPEGVVASTDRADGVEVRWDAVAEATGYRVERCAGSGCADAADWRALTAEPLGATRYEDATAAAPADLDAPAWVVATDYELDQVRVTWAEVTAPPAPRYRYRVVALGAGEESTPSAEAVGHRAERPLLGYEVRVGDGAWREARVGGGAESADAEWVDDEAPPATLAAPEVSASLGTYAELVRLVAAGAVAEPGEARTYFVRGTTAYGPGPSSAPATGHRTAGPLAYQWERSTTGQPDAFEPLPGATSPSHDDTTAPADGAVRWYRALVTAEGAEAVTSPAVAGARQAPPGVPGGVSATSDLEAHVLLTWQAVEAALGYHIYRDGVRLTGAGGVTTTSYQDPGAPGPTATWAAPSSLAATSDLTDRVELTWEAPERPVGPWVAYQVLAINAAGDGPLSAEADGRRAAPALVGYQVEVAPQGGSTSWLSTGSTSPTWSHGDPPKGTITGGTIAATQGDHRAHVRLTSSGASVAQAAPVTYRIRGVLADAGQTAASGSASGRRAVGALSRSWERGATTDDESFAMLVGASGVSFDDATAPSDGSRRWYRLRLTAAGADHVYAAPVEGWRLAFVQVSGGHDHTCAVATDGHVWCWGELWPGGVQEPARVTGLTNVVEVAAGQSKRCARTSSGDLWCWGAPYVGDGTTFHRSSPVHVLQGVATAAVGGAVSCAVLTAGQVWCWGYRFSVGDNTADDRASPVPVRTTSGSVLTGVTQVATENSAETHTCARLTTGAVWCWGQDHGSALGAYCPDTPGVCRGAVHASLAPNCMQVTAGDHFTCCVTSQETAACWGTAGGGVLGDGGVSTGGIDPVTVSGLTGVVEVQASTWASCARISSGRVHCWGENGSGQLGNGSASPFATTPVEVGSGLASVTALGAGAQHFCAIQGHDVWCWGDNEYGQLGPGDIGWSSNVPVKVAFP